jgi:hypothetical protein
MQFCKICKFSENQEQLVRGDLETASPFKEKQLLINNNYLRIKILYII